MRAQVVPKPRQPGHAVLRMVDIGAQPEGLTLRFERRHGSERYLAEHGWQKGEAWLAPERIERSGNAIDFHVGPVVADVLAGSTVRVAVREPGIGTVAETVVAWPSMLTSGASDPTHVVTEDPAGRTVRPDAPAVPDPPPAPEPVPEVLPVAAPEPAPLPPLRAEPRLERQKPTPSSWRLAFGGFALAAAVLAAGGWYFWPQLRPALQAMLPGTAPSAPAPAPAPIEKPLRVEVAEFLAGKPAVDAILAKGREYLAAGKPDATFLLWRAAADAGDSQAALAFAGFYDPVTPVAGSPVPFNGETAVLWYERAAAAGLSEAMRNLGLLYARGHATLPADKAKARTWLKSAADKGDAVAKQELDKLK